VFFTVSQEGCVVPFLSTLAAVVSFFDVGFGVFSVHAVFQDS
jgi:hypothetical protein